MTSFNMDYTGEAPVIPSFLMASATKKRRGRQRKGANSKTPESKAALKNGTENSEEKGGFHIPEGFLEILSNTQSESNSPAKKEPQRKPRGRKLKVNAPSLENSESESAPIKRSRRIQVLQEKKMSELAVEMEREQRILEQIAKKSSNKGTPQKSPVKAKETKSPRSKPKFQPPTPEESTSNTGMDSKRGTRKMNSRSRNMTKMHLMYEDESKDSEFSTSRETEKSKRRRRRGGANGKKGGYKPWDVSSESESTLEELTEEEEEEHEEEPLVFEVNEDEFACEEEDEDYVPVVVRRARTAKKIVEDTNIEAAVVNDDKPCSKCGKYDKPEWILLCDKCDSGYHTTCLIPPLMLIPEGDWYCQPCEHTFLCDWIQKELHELEVILKQREREQLRKQRLAYVGISLDNVLKPEKKEKSDEDSSEEQDNEDKEEEESEEDEPRKVKKNRKKDRDQESSSSEDEKLKKLYGKRSVRARRTVNYQFKEYDELIASAIGDELVDVKLPEEAVPKEIDDDEENDSDKAFQAKFPKQKKRKTTRLNDLDYSDDEDSGEEYKGSSASDSEKSVAPSVSGSDAGSGLSEEWKVVKKSKKGKKKKKSKKKSRRGRRDDSEEDWDDEELSDEDYKPVTRRSAARKTVSYREISSEDEWDPKPKATKKRKKSSTSYSEEDSEASYKKKKKKSMKAMVKAPKAKKKRVRKWASSESSEESERSEVFEESSGSENKWKVKKTKVSKTKSHINKKVLSSDEDEEEESPPKKKKEKKQKEKKQKKKKQKKKKQKKIVSEEESEEEESEEEEFEDEEEEDEEEEEEVNTPKVEEKNKEPKVVVKLPLKPFVPGQPAIVVTKDILPAAEPIKEKIVVSTVQDKSPIVRVVKKDATKMVPCVIPYDKSPKSGPEAEDRVGLIQTAPKPVPYAQTLPQQYLPRTVLPVHRPPVGVITRAPAPVIQTVPVPDRRPVTGQIVQPFSNEDDSDDEVPLERIPTAVPNPMPSKAMAYTPAKELPGFTYTAPEEKGYQPSYTNLAPYQDYSSRPTPLRPSLVEAYNRASPSKLTSLDSYPPVGSGRGPYPLKPSMVETYNRSSPSKLTALEPGPQGPYPIRPSMMDTYNRSSPSRLTPLEPGPQGPYPIRPTMMETYNRSSPSKLTPLEPSPQGPYPVKPSMMETYNRSSPSKLTPLEPSPQGPYPLKPSMMDTYNRSSPSKLTPLEPYSQSNSPKLLSLDSYSKKKQHFYGNPGGDHHPDMAHRPPPDSYQRDIGFPPEPTQFPPSPSTYHRSTPPHAQRDPGTPPRFHSQYPDGYAPPRSPDYYQNSPYYQGDERGTRPGGYQPNYPPPEHGGPYPPNPYVATPVPQPNGGFMIDTLLRARNPEDGEDELTGVTDIVSYITQE